MDFNAILSKVKISLSTAGKVAAKTAEEAGDTAKKVYTKSKHGVSIIEKNAEVDRLYKDIGRLVHLAHRDGEENAEIIEAKLMEIDAKLFEIEVLREKIDELSDTKTCASCNAKNDKKSDYCSKCGSLL